jgi:hypothetical protein
MTRTVLIDGTTTRKATIVKDLTNMALTAMASTSESGEPPFANMPQFQSFLKDMGAEISASIVACG